MALVQLVRPGLAGVFEPPSPALALVCAPAGFGKTTLVRDWLDAQEGLRCEWVDVDTGATGDEVAVVAEKALGRLVGGGVLVLDGARTTEQLRAIQPLLDALPGGVRAIVTSRARPTDELARNVTRGTAVLVSEDDLHLDLDQAVTLMTAIAGQPVPADRVQAVHDQLGGWITGLASVARSWQRASGDAAFARRTRSSLEVLDDVVIAEVLGSVDHEVRELITDLGYLPVLSPELADLLRQRDDSARLLARFRSGGGMVMPGEHDGWFVVHDALRGAVRRLHRASDERRALEVNAAVDWYLAQGEPVLAIRTLGDEGRWDVVPGLVKDHVPTLLRRGQIADVARVLRASPLDALLTQTRAVSQYAFFEIATGNVNRGLQVLNEFERWFTPRQVMGANIVRAAASVALADPRPALLAGEAAMEALDVHSEEIDNDPDPDYIPGSTEKYRIIVGGHLLVAGALTGEWRRVHAHRRELPGDVVATIATSALVSTYGNRAIHLALAGELDEAASLAEAGLDAAIDGDLFVEPATACARYARGAVSRSRGDWQASVDDLAGARDRAAGNNRLALLALAASTLAHALLDGGDLDGAVEALADVPPTPFDRARTLAGIVATARARVLLAEGDPAAALALLGGVRPTPMSASEQVAIALQVQAHAVAESALAHWPPDPTVDNRVRRGLALAARRSAIGEEQDAAHFARTVALAATHGLVQPVARLGEPLAPLLRGIGRRGRDRATLLAQHVLSAAPATPLPGRQLAVMQLLDEGLTLPAIAAELHISVSMVKKHTRAIYKALGAANRAEATRIWSSRSGPAGDRMP